MVHIAVVIFWAAIPCGLVGDYQCFRPEDGGLTFVRNVGNYLQKHWRLDSGPISGRSSAETETITT
jgi:hypothetical protein